MTLLRVDDPDGQCEHHSEDDDELIGRRVRMQNHELAGNLADDRHEDNDRHTVADTALGDELSHPHEQCGTCGHRDDDDDDRPRCEIRDQVDAVGELPAVEQVRKPSRLQQRKNHGHVPCPLCDDLPPALPVLLEGLEFRDDNRQKLQDDRRRDVRHDPQRKDRQLGQRTTREQVQEPDKSRLLSLICEIGNR